jgi:hypothetical protein
MPHAQSEIQVGAGGFGILGRDHIVGRALKIGRRKSVINKIQI